MPDFLLKLQFSKDFMMQISW